MICLSFNHMGNQLSGSLSSKNEYANNPLYCICNAYDLQQRLIAHRLNPLMIKFLEEIPVACNYSYDAVTRVANANWGENHYRDCTLPLYFHMGSLTFCSDCQIILTKHQYAKMIEVEKSVDVPLDVNDYVKMLRWVGYSNYFTKKLYSHNEHAS